MKKSKDEKTHVARLLLWVWMAESGLTAAEIRAIFVAELEALKDEEGFALFMETTKAIRTDP